ncbi:MAG: phosphoribosyltransferase [Halofilum sp. (in: g-proteobacteria)]
MRSPPRYAGRNKHTLQTLGAKRILRIVSGTGDLSNESGAPGQVIMRTGNRFRDPSAEGTSMVNTHIFADRIEAGTLLARELAAKNYDHPVVLALPRGGVPVAAGIAGALSSRLDIVLVRKIGVPRQPGLTLGAVVDGGHPEVVINEHVLSSAWITEDEFERLEADEIRELERCRRTWLAGRERAPLNGRTVIVVDDGIATGATARAAIKGLRQRNPLRIVLAVPVAPPDTIRDLQDEADEVICLQTPGDFGAIGFFYHDFRQTSDDEVVALLAQHRGDET